MTWRYWIFSVLVLGLLRDLLVADDRFFHNRWAVVATPDVQETGLGDLLTAELSKLDGAELVDRAQLDAAMKELELSALFGAEAAAGRLKLGHVLGADVLVLLSRETGTPQTPATATRYLKLLLCDCTCGARLRVEYLPEVDGPARLAEKIAGIVRQVRTQFKDGLRAVVGVPPFVSRNLTHDFDRLQTGYAEVVEAALSSHPGVAVVEIAEARAVATELQRTGAELKQRPVPVCVEGQFKMSTLKMEPDTRVHLAIRVTDGGTLERHARAGPLSPRQAVGFLSGSMARGVLRIILNEPCENLSADDQLRLLTSRADTFAALGDWRRSTDLREAALLLKPDDIEQALRSIVETVVLLQPPTRDFLVKSYGVRKGRSEEEQRDRRDRWKAMLLHVESAIRLRRLNPREAHVLVCMARQTADHLAGIGPEPWRKEEWRKFERVGDLWRQPKPPEVRRQLDQFFRQVYPLLPGLDPEVGSGTIRELLVPAILSGYHQADDSDTVIAECRKEMSADDQYTLWSGAMIWNVKAAAATEFSSYGTTDNVSLSDGYLRNGIHYDSRCYYDTVFWLLTNVELRPFSMHPFRNNRVMRPDWQLRIEGVPGVSTPVLPGSPIPWPAQEEEEQLERLVVRLEESERPDLVFLARSMRFLDAYEQLRYDAFVFRKDHGPREPFPPKMAAQFTRVEEQLAELTDMAQANGYQSAQPPPVWDPLAGLRICREEYARHRKFVEPKTGPLSKPEDRRPPVKSDDDAPPPSGVDLAFEPIESIEEDCRRLVHCDTWDVIHNGHAYTDHRLIAVREDGHAEPLFTLERRDQIVSMKYDGRGVWLATLKGGIRLLDTQGRKVAAWSADDGLPGYDRRLILYPLGPGRCLAIGLHQAEGAAPRNWFAVLECPEGRAAPIRMVHTATKVADATDAADQGFEPIWAAPWRDADAPQKPLLLVGRCNGPPNRIPDQWQRRPLIVDLDSFEVRVSPGRFPAINSGKWAYEFLMIEGPRVFIGSGKRVHMIEPPSEGEDRWTWRSIPAREETGPRTSPYSGKDNVPISPLTTIEWQDRLLNRTVGGWWTFDPQSEKLDKLSYGAAAGGEPIGVSAHYGPVAWRDGKLLRVRIGADRPGDELQD